MNNSRDNWPKISILTPTFNQGQYIEETIQSILSQGYPNLEYVIIDGGSSDNTVDIIKKYEKHLSYWVSEKDTGQANAINRGLKFCTGEIFNWINSDDYLEPRALFRIAEAFEDKSIDAVAGQVNNFSSNQNEVVPNQFLSAEGLMCWHHGVKFIQPGVWLRRDNIQKCGGIDEQFHYAFDWDLVIRYLYFFPQVKYLRDLLVHFRLHEQSKTVSSNERFSNEERKIIEKIYYDSRFANIHTVCKWKIDYAQWTTFLNETANAYKRTRVQKLRKIAANLYQQPTHFKGIRMTLGAIKQIILTNKVIAG